MNELMDFLCCCELMLIMHAKISLWNIHISNWFGCISHEKKTWSSEWAMGSYELIIKTWRYSLLKVWIVGASGLLIMFMAEKSQELTFTNKIVEKFVRCLGN